MKLMPQEVEVRYILPTIRKEFARELSSRNISQNKIAKILELTPAAVSMYFNEKRALSVNLSKNNKEEIEKSVSRILEKSSDSYEEMYKISKLLTKDGTICNIHRMLDKNIRGDCKICLNQ